MKWNNCERIYHNGKFSVSKRPDKQMMKAYLKYRETVLNNPKMSIWFDHEKKICFGQEQTWLSVGSKESYFISDKENFIDNNIYNLKALLSYYGEILGTDVSVNQEVIRSNHPVINSVEGTKVLVVGGGPTTKERKINYEDYDHIFTCNHFFLNKELVKHNITLATFTDETDLSLENTELHNYLKNNSTVICFEDKFLEENRDDFRLIKENYPERAVFAHTRYRGKIGSAPRLLCIAALLGAKEIHVVGMDGLKKGEKAGDVGNHSFQPNKINQGTVDYDLYRRHYVMLWDYLLHEIGKDIKFQNLGEGHPSNMTTDISRQMFSLEVAT